MQCPKCKSDHIRKNGLNRQHKQNYVCVNCSSQFITDYEIYHGYSDEFKRECLKMYVNGMGFRAIQRVKGVHHTTVITWVKEAGKILSDSYKPETVPQVGELDELETFVGNKKAARPRVAVRRKGMLAKTTRFGTGCAVDHFKPGILGWVLGDHSAETFEPLWKIVSQWQCYFYVTDGWKVYPQFIPDGDQIVCKTYMTRVEGENTRLRHYSLRLANRHMSIARLHRKTLCYSKSQEMLKYSIRLLVHYLRFWDVPITY